jgi:hypothetical protein
MTKRSPGSGRNLQHHMIRNSPSRQVVVCCFLIAAVGLTCSHLAAKMPKSFRDSEDIAPAKVERLMREADNGNVDAALTLARYHWIVKNDRSSAERFLTLATKSGSLRACDALIAFYVSPSGIFQPEKALFLRRSFAKKYGYKSHLSDSKWAYESSFEYRYSSEAEMAARRRTLLLLAASLGSKDAGAELRDFNRYQRNPVRVSPADMSKLKRG